MSKSGTPVTGTQQAIPGTLSDRIIPIHDAFEKRENLKEEIGVMKDELQRVEDELAGLLRKNNFQSYHRDGIAIWLEPGEKLKCKRMN